MWFGLFKKPNVVIVQQRGQIKLYSYVPKSLKNEPKSPKTCQILRGCLVEKAQKLKSNALFGQLKVPNKA